MKFIMHKLKQNQHTKGGKASRAWITVLIKRRGMGILSTCKTAPITKQDKIYAQNCNSRGDAYQFIQRLFQDLLSKYRTLLKACCASFRDLKRVTISNWKNHENKQKRWHIYKMCVHVFECKIWNWQCSHVYISPENSIILEGKWTDKVLKSHAICG